MKHVISTLVFFLAVTMFHKAQAYDLPEIGMDDAKIEAMIESGQLTEDQENALINYLESGGATADAEPIQGIDTEAVAQFEKYLAERDKNQNWNDIAGGTTQRELQDAAVKQVVGKGQWAFDFVFIDKKGTRHFLSSLNVNQSIRPASTMKIFTAWAAYRRGSYPVGTIGHLLKWSSNIEADAALRTVADREKNFKIPDTSYLKNLIGYKMYMKKRAYVIDAKVAKGAAVMINDYAGLTDSNKFHPVNGSGLQDSDKDKTVHENRVTPRLQTSLLYTILNSGKYDKFKVLLAQPGGTGTLKRNFKTLRTKAKIYAKTGTLGNSKSLAGYVQIPQGTIVFSVIGDYLRGCGPADALSGPIENLVFLNHKYVVENFK